ncbi:MAG: MBL fold metallo-hydrolase [Chloroflexi bacterium]|nr:MBL fold metallo-hydrolase [Chloroflexota bacterium]MCL5107940.1 MBL fold metallo-hydrolase [Chloroflexota bacterium]
MKLTVIGNNGAVPRPGGACNGYLVQEGDSSILLDCGTGAFSQLERFIDPLAVDAVFISHMHADHFFDLVPYRYALLLTLGPKRPAPLPLWLPNGCGQVLENFAASFGGAAHFFGEAFALHEYNPGDVITVGDLSVTVVELRHFIPSYGLRVAGNGTLAYSADTAYCEAALALAAGCDAFLCEATMQDATYARGRAGHLSASDAGRLAQQAGVPRLLLTHIWYELDSQISLREARATYGGRLELALEGQSYDIIVSDGRPG